MISIILIVFIILIVMSRRLDIDLDINVTEDFDPIEESWICPSLDEMAKVIKEIEESLQRGRETHIRFNKLIYGPDWKDEDESLQRSAEVQIFLNELVYKHEEEEVVEDDCYSGYIQTKRLLTFEEAFDKMQRKYSKRGKHGHKGYTRVQTLAYKKARAFKTAHLNEWC